MGARGVVERSQFPDGDGVVEFLTLILERGAGLEIAGVNELTRYAEKLKTSRFQLAIEDD